MQLARGFFLTPEKKLKRKIIEIAITFQLENRFNKQQIFQLLRQPDPAGQQGSFASTALARRRRPTSAKT